MAGTLTISTLSDCTNSTSSTNCIKGSAKAWVNWTGGTTTINASYNVSSITRSATGNYTVNFTTALTDANYAVGFAFSNSGVVSGLTANIGLVGPNGNSNTYSAAGITTTSCQFLVSWANSTPLDPTGFSSMIFLR